MWLYCRQLLFFFLLSALGMLLISLQSIASNNIERTINKALNGNIEAQNLLGDIYFKGSGLSRDYSKAHAWYRTMALFGDNSSSSKITELQHQMSDDEIYNAIKEYNYIYRKIAESTNDSLNYMPIGQISNCDAAEDRLLKLVRKDQKNFTQENTISNFCQIADDTLTIWTEIENIVIQCPSIDKTGLEYQFAKETIHWAIETKLRTCIS